MAKQYIRSRATRYTTVLGFTKSSSINEVGVGTRHVGQDPKWPEWFGRFDEAEEMCRTSRRKCTLRLDYLPAWQVAYLEEYVARAELHQGRKITVTELISLAINHMYSIYPLPEPEDRKKGGR